MAGNANSGRKADAMWADAIRLAIKRREDNDPKALHRLAEVLLTKCAEGDMAALKELGDRLDGKARQQLTVGGPDDTPLQVTLVKLDPEAIR